MISAAGHSFDTWGVCYCGRRWTDIRSCTRADIGQEGIAHVGALSEYEYSTIEAARNAEDERIAAAMEGVSR